MSNIQQNVSLDSIVLNTKATKMSSSPAFMKIQGWRNLPVIVFMI